ncbi:hypothetical protein [uncultured Algimonas sp.]|uniref:hypothetical protein n=1 Tax=uncultured Algimonas sp. TaxID=1547920 RepID=UPI00261F9A89|nr:hypothetical protein [uncultured Algimonas sp.]
MFKKILIALSYLLISINTYAKNASNYLSEFAAGNFIIAEFVDDYAAAFDAGDQIIMGLSGGENHVKLMGSVKAVAYPNTNFEVLSSKVVSIWGARFTVEDRPDGSVCLVLYNHCYAVVKGIVFDSDYTKADFYNIVNSSIKELRRNRRPGPVSGACNVTQDFVSYRKTGEALFRAAQLLDAIPFETTNNVYVAELEAAVDWLMSNYSSDFHKTEYYTCFGSSEFMTAHLVVRGIYEYYKYRPKTIYRTYLANVLQHVGKSDHAKTIIASAAVAPDQTQKIYANMHAQYISAMVIADELKVLPLPSHVDGVFRNILSAQSLADSRQICTEKRIKGIGTKDYLHVFGGWAHSVNWSALSGPSDAKKCRQSMGYHVLTTDALLIFEKWLNAASPSQLTNFPLSSSQLKWSLRASMAYFKSPFVVEDNPQSIDFGMYFGHAEGSVDPIMFSEGNAFGGTSQFAIDFLYRAFVTANWNSTPSGTHGERVSMSELKVKSQNARSYVEGELGSRFDFWLASYVNWKIRMIADS